MAYAIEQLLVVDMGTETVAGIAGDADLLALGNLAAVVDRKGRQMEVVGLPATTVVDDDVIAGAAGLVIAIRGAGS